MIRNMTNSATMMVPCGDGEMPVHTWLPKQGSGPAILLIQEIFGVSAYIRDVAERLAGAGYVVGAPELFWRFAPGFETTPDEAGLGEAFETAQELDRETAVTDSVAALDALATRSDVAGVPGVIGYCLGGTLGFAVAIDATPSVLVSYYGSGVPDMLDRIDAVTCPTLFHFGNADAFIPNEQVEAVDAAITTRPGFVLNVENAGHAFDNHERADFWNESASNAAWAKTMAFLGEHLPT